MKRGRRRDERADATARNIFRFPAERVRAAIDPGAIVEPATIILLANVPGVRNAHIATEPPGEDDGGGRAA